jgi:uncharacterized protein
LGSLAKGWLFQLNNRFEVLACLPGFAQTYRLILALETIKMKTMPPPHSNPSILTSSLERLEHVLSEMKSVVVACSGGVDSGLVLRVARTVLGRGGVLAVTAKSQTSANHEMESAARLALEFDADHLVIESFEMQDPEFVKNLANRCYICKKGRFSAISEIARERGAAFVVDGSNVDDRSDFRPGMKAIEELGVRSPLMEAGLCKAEIRLLANHLGLSIWNKPAYACLATRIPRASPITAQRLKRIDACEDLVREIGVSGQVRVRDYADTARIEVAPEDMAKLIDSEVRGRLGAFFKEQGFRFVTLDLEGYSMGSTNRE